MYSALTTLLDRLDSPALSDTDVISWGCPVPSFGDLSTSVVATLGLNPSNREFVDESGRELQGADRRFHTLQSLGLESWADVNARHLRLILDSCRRYFLGNPYDRWFKKLDQVISGAGTSYYGMFSGACHLDLIPYATKQKWAVLSPLQRATLLTVAGDTLALLLRDSPVRVIVLNGRSVVEHFQLISGVKLKWVEMPGWSLPRNSTTDVTGMAVKGFIETLSGIDLSRRTLVLGFNHNIQSSFGVTSEVMSSIRAWIHLSSRKVLQ